MSSKLEKRYGLPTAIAMVIGIVVGSGVFFKAQNVLNSTNGDMPLGIIAWLIGGVVIYVGDTVIDGSLKSRLKDIKEVIGR